MYNHLKTPPPLQSPFEGFFEEEKEERKESKMQSEEQTEVVPVETNEEQQSPKRVCKESLKEEKEEEPFDFQALHDRLKNDAKFKVLFGHFCCSRGGIWPSNTIKCEKGTCPACDCFKEGEHV